MKVIFLKSLLLAVAFLSIQSVYAAKVPLSGTEIEVQYGPSGVEEWESGGPGKINISGKNAENSVNLKLKNKSIENKINSVTICFKNADVKSIKDMQSKSSSKNDMVELVVKLMLDNKEIKTCNIKCKISEISSNNSKKFPIDCFKSIVIPVGSKTIGTVITVNNYGINDDGIK